MMAKDNGEENIRYELGLTARDWAKMPPITSRI
jgi:hypothetical protein